MGDTEGKDLLRTTSSHVRSAKFRPDERTYTQSDLYARIAAAQQETLKLASEHYRRFDSANLQSFCTCGWKEPNNEKNGIENWRDHIQSLLPAAPTREERGAIPWAIEPDELCPEDVRSKSPYARREPTARESAQAERIKRLLEACTFALEEIDNRYDVDEPEPGRQVEHPFPGAGAVMQRLRAALEAR